MQNRLKTLIRQSGMSQVELAERLGMSKVGINKIISTTQPRFSTMEKIAEILNVPLWKLYLTDDEIFKIQKEATRPAMDGFVCPKCGTQLKIIIADNSATTDK